MKTELSAMRRTIYVPVDPKKAASWINRSWFATRGRKVGEVICHDFKAKAAPVRAVAP